MFYEKLHRLNLWHIFLLLSILSFLSLCGLLLYSSSNIVHISMETTLKPPTGDHTNSNGDNIDNLIVDITEAELPTTTISSASPLSSSSLSSLSAIQGAVQRLKELEINFLALDFDQTILDIHTGGVYRGTVEELYSHVRPVFVQLIQAAQDANIEVAIVTFSGQTKIIRGVLDWIMAGEHITNIPGSTNNNHFSSRRIPIRGGDRSWSYQGKGSMDGKQPHMASAVEELEHRFNVDITKKSTLLIDDDGRNIRHALREGVRAVWFNPKKPHRLLPEIIKLS